MRIRTPLTIAGLAIPLVLGPAAVASAQEYGGTGSTTEDRKDGGDTDVLGATVERPASAPAAPAVAATTRQAPAGGSTLPVTGGDLLGLAVIGVSLVGGGTVLVRRTRRPVAV